MPQPYNSRHLKAPEHFQNSLPPSTAGDASFFRSGSGEGLSERGHGIPSGTGVFLMSGLTIGTNLLHVNIGRFATKGWVFKRVVLADVLSHHLVCV